MPGSESLGVSQTLIHFKSENLKRWKGEKGRRGETHSLSFSLFHIRRHVRTGSVRGPDEAGRSRWAH